MTAVYWSWTFNGVRSQLEDVRAVVAEAVGPVLLKDAIIEGVLLLADNAIMHSLSGDEGGKFQVQMTRGLDYWIIRVDDSGSVASHPHRRPRETDAIHGLERLQEIATSWGVLGGENGYAVFAEFEHQPPKN